MSEFVSESEPIDDPEPPSGGLYEFIQTSIIEPSRYVDDGLAEEYRHEQEKIDIPALSKFADTLLMTFNPNGDPLDQRIRRGGAMLRRRREGTIIQYFFTNIIDEQEYGREYPEEYCRAWTNGSREINWCYNEQRHEPAADVQANIERAFFPPAPENPRKLGKLSLSSLIRQKV